MRERCPNSHPRGKVVLTDYQLCFDEYSSRWGGGVATIAKKVGKQVFVSVNKRRRENTPFKCFVLAMVYIHKKENSKSKKSRCL